ncbi:LPXTG cell wall anchor domain-containing protein [Agromyces endophyticus]|uniref:prealbumin-like fold domain-containing protein n=1 Tax=Agromyces sp. H17E-10 TaxID=2932244 RepID=UPI001FD06E36|nr:LPXTG cell wall anchor domain-containing protein [Agromyces sp. H17E-10]UOQ88189.1 LPXTG cell wall anchor domain-containing protein [Agromyces sp. H17E-10]
MPRRKLTAAAAIAALFGALLTPALLATPASAVTLPSGLQTGFQIDGDMDGGTLPDTFDWHSFMSPLQPDGPSTFTSPGPYTTAQGFQSTGIVYGTSGWDNVTLDAACDVLDATGSPGSQQPNTNPWAPGPANVNAKGDVCSGGAAYEVITDDQGDDHVVLYMYWTRLTGNGDMSTFETLEGPEAGRCDDFLVEFNYDSTNNATTAYVLKWTPTSGDACADPDGAGSWSNTGAVLDFTAAVGQRTEGPAPTPGDPGTFGEIAVDLSAAGLFSPDTCTGFATGTGFSRTGNAEGAQIQDYIVPQNPLVITNCGALSITKLSDPPAITSTDQFDYTVERAGGGDIYPDQTTIDESLRIGETDVWPDVLAGEDYTLSEVIGDDVPWELLSMSCQIDDRIIVLDSPDDVFPVEANNVTACKIVNTTSWVTVEKQTLPDGAPDTFGFTVGDTAVQLTDGQTSAPIYFRPGTQVAVDETDLPEGWNLTDVTCTPEGTDTATGATVTTVAGEGVNCVFTNTQNGSIQVHKVVDGQEGAVFSYTGSWLDDPSTFEIDATDGSGDSEVYSVEPGTYDLSEAALEGYDTTGLVCVDPDQGTAADLTDYTAVLDVDPGEFVECTYTNTQRGEIRVDKETIPDEWNQDFDFSLTGEDTDEQFTLNDSSDDEANPWSSGLIVPGSYVVAETVPAHWVLDSISCGSAEGPMSAITLEPGAVITCVFTNEALPGSVTVEKSVEGVADGFEWAFDLTISPVPGEQAGTQTVSGTGEGSDSATWTGLVPGDDYTVFETAVDGWNMGEITCTGGDGALEDGNGDAPGFQFTAEIDTEIECALTNEAVPGQIEVTKSTVGGDGTFDFELTPLDAEGAPAGDPVVESVTTEGGEGTAVFDGVLPGGRFSLAEADPGEAWVAGDLACTVDPVGEAGPSPIDANDFTVQPGDLIACAIENVARGPLEIVKTVDGPAVNNGDGTWDVSYTITVTSQSATDESYDLSDELKYGDGITVLEASITGPEGIAINPDWDGIENLAVATAVLPAGETHVYAVSVTSDVASDIASDQADCAVASSDEGSGELNSATIEFWSGSASSEDCAPVTPEQPPLPSTGASLTAGWLGLGVIAAGGLLLFLRRRRSVKA